MTLCPNRFAPGARRRSGAEVSVWGRIPETAAYLLALGRQGLTYAQIFDRNRTDRPDCFLWRPDGPECKQEREEAIDAIEKTVRSLKSKLKTAVDRVDASVPAD